MSKRYVNVGSMLRGKEDDAEGRPSYYIKFSEDSNIVIDGVNFTGRTVSVRRPDDKYKYMLEKGKMKAEEAEEKIASYQEGGKLSFVKFELQAVIDN